MRLTFSILTEWSSLYVRVSREIFLPALHEVCSFGSFASVLSNTNLNINAGRFKLQVQQHAQTLPQPQSSYFDISTMTPPGMPPAAARARNRGLPSVGGPAPTNTTTPTPPSSLGTALPPRGERLGYLKQVGSFAEEKVNKMYNEVRGRYLLQFTTFSNARGGSTGRECQASGNLHGMPCLVNRLIKTPSIACALGSRIHTRPPCIPPRASSSPPLAPLSTRYISRARIPDLRDLPCLLRQCPTRRIMRISTRSSTRSSICTPNSIRSNSSISTRSSTRSSISTSTPAASSGHRLSRDSNSHSSSNSSSSSSVRWGF